MIKFHFFELVKGNNKDDAYLFYCNKIAPIIDKMV